VTSTEVSNERLARSFFQLLYDGDVEGAVALLDPAGEIQQMMHRKFWPIVGWQAAPGSDPYPVMPMEGFRTELRSLGEAYDCQTFRFVVDEVVAAGDRVVLTVHNEGQYPDGEPYEMGYCFIFTIRDGKIVHAIEYADTHYGFANREAGTLNMAMAAERPELADKVRAAVAAGGRRA
jgi:ketosteroid isomerase-like protein